MLLSVVNCSEKMSVHGRTDIDPERADEVTGIEWGIGEQGEGEGGG